MRHLIDPLDLTREETDALLTWPAASGRTPPPIGTWPCTSGWLPFSTSPPPAPACPLRRPCSTWAARCWASPATTCPAPRRAKAWPTPSGWCPAMRTSPPCATPKRARPGGASRYSRIPVINAGDGGHQHPTQTLTDLMTIRTRKGTLNGLTIGLCGDLKFGRTVHSLIKTMVRYEGVRFVLISPEEPACARLHHHRHPGGQRHPLRRDRSLEESMPGLDILYMTRVQRERFFNEEDYIRLKNSYILTREKMALAKPDMAVLHPPAPGQRDRPGCGRRPPGRLFRAGAERRLRPHGPHHDPAGPARPQSPQGGNLIC